MGLADAGVAHLTALPKLERLEIYSHIPTGRQQFISQAFRAGRVDRRALSGSIYRRSGAVSALRQDGQRGLAESSPTSESTSTISEFGIYVLALLIEMAMTWRVPKATLMPV